MSFERQPRQEPVRLEYLKELAQDDVELSGLYEGIVSAIDGYVLAKIKGVRLAENSIARYALAEKFEAKLNDSNQDRFVAHNRLIKSLEDFATRCRDLKLDTFWWDGPEGLSQDSEHQSARRHIDDWASDIFLQNEEDEKRKNSRRKGKKQVLQPV